MTEVLTFVVALICAAVVLRPNLRRIPEGSRGELVPDPAREIEAEKEIFIAALRELDFDYGTGKVSAEDYKSVRAGLEARAADAMKRIDETDARFRSFQAQIESELSRRLSRPENGHAQSCPACGAGLSQKDRYCGSCGRNRDLSCTSCGTAAPEGSRFCPQCGAPLGDACG